jgi:hypothetical protein
MGLRPLDESKWLEVDAKRESELALKRELLEKKRDVVVSARESARAPSEELLALVLENLEKFHPDLSRDAALGEHPIVQASLLVQEDLCVLVRSDVWRLEGACVCFPSRWNLASKVGTTLDAIHDPVPGYGDALSQPTNAFFDRLKPDRSFWRLNWTLLDDPALHQPSGHRQSPGGSPDQWFFRVERQTLRQLPTTGAVVFTIRTYVASIHDLKSEHADFGRDLLFALDSAPPATATYKGWTGVADQLRAVLS